MLKEIARTIELEGGYVNNPADRGSETKFGISQKSFPNEDIANLTEERAGELYLQHFWIPWRCSEIYSMRVRWKFFDIGINMGESRAAKIIQAVVNVPIDGVAGSGTIQAINDHVGLPNGEELVFGAMVRAQATRYEEIVARDPSQKVFLKGWLNRAHKDLDGDYTSV